MLSMDDYSGQIDFMARNAVTVGAYFPHDELETLKFVTQIGNLYEESLKTKDEEKLKKICEKMDKIQRDFAR